MVDTGGLRQAETKQNLMLYELAVAALLKMVGGMLSPPTALKVSSVTKAEHVSLKKIHKKEQWPRRNQIKLLLNIYGIKKQLKRFAFTAIVVIL